MTSASGDDRRRIDFDEPFGSRQRDDDKSRAYRMDAFDVFTDDFVDIFPVPNVRQVNDEFTEVFDLTAALFNELTDILHDFVGLCDRISDADIFGCIQILGTLSADKDNASRGDYRLAQIVSSDCSG